MEYDIANPDFGLENRRIPRPYVDPISVLGELSQDECGFVVFALSRRISREDVSELVRRWRRTDVRPLL